MQTSLSLLRFFLLFIFLKFLKVVIDFREREININLLLHLQVFMHSLATFCMCPDHIQNYNHGILGWHSITNWATWSWLIFFILLEREGRKREKYQFVPFTYAFSSWFLFYFLLYWFLQIERKGERNINLLFHLFMHSLVYSCICPDWGPKQQLCIGGRCSDQLSYPARADSFKTILKPYITHRHRQ